MTRGSLGRFGESWACGYLARQGYRILERNIRYRHGELDIIAEEGGDLVFVEVKCRRSRAYGTPEDSITPTRFAHLERAIASYLMDRNLGDRSRRVDVMAIEVGANGQVVRHELLRNVGAPGT